MELCHIYHRESIIRGFIKKSQRQSPKPNPREGLHVKDIYTVVCLPLG